MDFWTDLASFVFGSIGKKRVPSNDTCPTCGNGFAPLAGITMIDGVVFHRACAKENPSGLPAARAKSTPWK